MATDRRSRWRWTVRLLFLALVALPVVAPYLDATAPLLAAVDAATLVRGVGLVAAVLVVGLLVWQKRRSRGQQTNDDGSEETGDRQVEGSGEVYAPYAYNSQQQARRESKQIQDRAEEIAEADREARKRR